MPEFAEPVPVRMPLVRVALPLDEWIRLLGYLEGVGMGDELEHHGWIQTQVRSSFVNGKEAYSSDD